MRDITGLQKQAEVDRALRRMLWSAVCFGYRLSSMLTNGAMFSTFKSTDSHTVCCRPTRKDVLVIYERIFRNGPFRELKMAIESHDFAKTFNTTSKRTEMRTV